MQKYHYKVVAYLTPTTTQRLGYTSSPKHFAKECLKEGWKLEQLHFILVKSK